MRKLRLEELDRVSVDGFKSQPKRPIVLVLDNIRSGLNVGSIFRTADAFSIEEIILCGITAQPPHREVLKSAIGATDSVAWQYVPDVEQAIGSLQKRKYLICGVEQTTKSMALHEFSWSLQRIALVLGNEVSGISDAILPSLDLALEVPQFGSKHSLNVAVCTGIVLWHLVAQNVN